MTTTETHQTIEAVWRIESARLIAGLTRIVHDVGIAEELAQDALLAALQQWPASGIPDNPGAWLMSTAKHRAIDHLRRSAMLNRKHELLGRELAVRESQIPDLAAAMDDHIGDDLLRLVFIACHPVLSAEARTLAMVSLICAMAAAPAVADSRAARARRLASPECLEAASVRAERDSSDELVSTRAAACSLAPWATDWLEEAISEEAEDTWPAASATWEMASASATAVAFTESFMRACSPR